MKKIKEMFLYANWKNIFFALLGSAILAFGTNYIYANSHIPEGGMIGLCLIIEHFTGIHPSISNIVITLFCYLIAWRLMGTKYVLNTSVATIGFSVFYAIFSSPALDGLIPSMAQYPLLAALVGALFVEVGTGITHRYGSAPSGEQALTMAIVKRGALEFGWVQFFRDFTVLSLSIVTYTDKTQGLYSIIYAILIMTLTTPITDYIVNAPKKADFVKRVKRTKRSWGPIFIIGIILATIMTATTIYLNEVYNKSDKADSYVVENVTVEEISNKLTVYKPNDETTIKAGLVFYPGGKVHPDAYAPLLKECASRGILCVSVKMPFNIAIFGINQGLDVPSLFPEIERWYIGGHNLGGAMGASCAANNKDIFEGVVLLGSYSTVDIKDHRVISILGSLDKIVGEKNYRFYSKNLPDEFSGNFSQVIIPGANHSYFGMYGLQSGDAEATITNELQIQTAAKAIAEFITSKE